MHCGGTKPIINKDDPQSKLVIIARKNKHQNNSHHSQTFFKMLIFNWKSYKLYVSDTINHSSIGISDPHIRKNVP